MVNRLLLGVFFSICIFFETSFGIGEELNGAPEELKEDAQLLNQLESLNREFEDGGFKVYIYNPKGRRNPFEKSFSTQENVEEEKFGIEAFDVASFTLTSIMWNIKKPKALVRVPTGQSYVVEEGVRIGRRGGYVAKIREDELIVVEKKLNIGGAKQKYKTQVLKIGR